MLSNSFKELQTQLTLENSSLASRMHSIDARLGKLTLSLSKAEKETIKVVNQQISDALVIKESLEQAKEELHDRVQQINGFIKKVKKSGASITADEILSNTKVFEELVELFIENITINKEDIVFNIVEINE